VDEDSGESTEEDDILPIACDCLELLTSVTLKEMSFICRTEFASRLMPRSCVEVICTCKLHIQADDVDHELRHFYCCCFWRALCLLSRLIHAVTAFAADGTLALVAWLFLSFCFRYRPTSLQTSISYLTQLPSPKWGHQAKLLFVHLFFPTPLAQNGKTVHLLQSSDRKSHTGVTGRGCCLLWPTEVAKTSRITHIVSVS